MTTLITPLRETPPAIFCVRSPLCDFFAGNLNFLYGKLKRKLSICATSHLSRKKYFSVRDCESDSVQKILSFTIIEKRRKKLKTTAQRLKKALREVPVREAGKRQFQLSCLSVLTIDYISYLTFSKSCKKAA